MTRQLLVPLVEDCIRMAGQHEVQVALAETTTGGKIAATIAQVAGASRFLESAIVPYGLYARTRLLGVSPLLLDQYGAVSEEAAEAMAEGLLAQSDAALVLAETGIAGPTGGSPEKPLGLVHLVVKGRWGYSVHRELRFQGNRFQIQGHIVKQGLDELFVALRSL
jgi:PncC family amidohydrolase